MVLAFVLAAEKDFTAEFVSLAGCKSSPAKQASPSPASFFDQCLEPAHQATSLVSFTMPS
jgi:hypothetical protein